MTTSAPPSARPRPDRGERMAERRRTVAAARVRRRRRILGWLLVAALVLPAGWGAAHSPLFGLSRIDVRGNAMLSAAEIRSAAGLRLGEPVLNLDLPRAAARVEQLPWVRSAVVRRSASPSGVVIEVVERRPAAIVFDATRAWLVAADGVVLAPAGASAPRLPSVGAGPLVSGLEPGDRLAPDGPVANALTALGGMRRQLAAQVAGIQAPTLDQLTFTLHGGTQLVYGLAEQQAAKDAAALLLLARAAAEHRRALRIDVRSPSTPTLQTS